MLRILLIVLVIYVNSTVSEDHPPPNLTKREGLAGHNGIFAALPWSDYELAKVSSLHATASYPQLMEMIRAKLAVSGADISLNERRRIERLLKTLRPPPVFDHFLSDEEIEKVRIAHSNHEVGTILSVIGQRLQKLPEYAYNQAVSYIQRHTPIPDEF